MTTSESILTRIQALLDKAASTDYEAEADTYLAKAQQLMIRYSVDQAALAAVRGSTHRDPEPVTSREFPIGQSRPDQVLLTAAAVATDSQVFIRAERRPGQRQRRSSVAVIVGTDTDITHTRALYASLTMQRENALRHNNNTADHPRSFNHSFRLSFAVRVHERLTEMHAHATDEVPGAALVLANKAQQVEAYVREQFPRVKATSLSASSSAGILAGQQAGNRAALGGTTISADTVPALTS